MGYSSERFLGTGQGSQLSCNSNFLVKFFVLAWKKIVVVDYFDS